MTAKIFPSLSFRSKTDDVVFDVRAVAKELVKVGTTEFTKNMISR